METSNLPEDIHLAARHYGGSLPVLINLSGLHLYYITPLINLLIIRNPLSYLRHQCDMWVVFERGKRFCCGWCFRNYVPENFEII